MSMTPHQEEMLKELHTAIVGNEGLGHVGLVRRMSSVEKMVQAHDPIIQSYMSKSSDTKQLKKVIIGACLTTVGALATHITLLLLNHK